jgi:hypothetical protein
MKINPSLFTEIQNFVEVQSFYEERIAIILLTID